MAKMVMLCVVAVLTAAAEAAHHAAPTPAVDCNSVVLNLADCLTFVTNGSTVTKPEGSCCSGLKMVLKSNPECLCEGFKNSAQLGVVLNVTKALSLPSACHVSAPSVSNCGLSLGGGASPAPSPSASAASPLLSPPPIGAPFDGVGIGPSQLAPAPAQGDSANSAMVPAASFAAAMAAALLALL